MLKDTYYVIGVMSGTSLDGIDLAHVKFYKSEGKWNFSILNSETISYSEYWLGKLKNLVQFNKEELLDLDINYTRLLSEVINSFVAKHGITKIDTVCSHGHTALHQPDDGLTYQIGNRPELAKLINENVVCDFRVQDVLLGGQGAPLVPIGDELLFSEYDCCINLGGFANISTNINTERIAYDICPANIVLNYYVSKLGLAYDDNGMLASKGEIHSELLQQLNALKFYKQSFPKSLGLEWVKYEVFPLIDSFSLKIETILRTFVEHIAIQISKTIQPGKLVLVTGGGVYNEFLMQRILEISQANITIPSKEIIEYKEALIFGLLGILKLREEVNCLASVTGALKNHSSGIVFHP